MVKNRKAQPHVCQKILYTPTVIQSITPEVRKAFPKKLSISKISFCIKTYFFPNKRKNPSQLRTFEPQYNLRKYKINDNPNAFILLRLYYYNQLNKTALVPSLLNIYKCNMFLEAYECDVLI